MAIATLGHVELECRDLEASRNYFYDIIGLEESFATDTKVYMRAWGDWDSYTLILTEGNSPGVNHIGFKTESISDLYDYSERIQQSGYEVDWVENADPYQNEAIRFSSPADFSFELFHEIDKANIPDEKTGKLKNQPQEAVNRGVGPRRIDHINLYTENVEEATDWFIDVLDFQLREQAVSESEDQIAAWLSVSPLVHEIAFVDGEKSLLNHIAYYMNSEMELYQAADILRQKDAEIVGGPGKHGVSQAKYIYTRGPSGNQIEVFAGGYLIFDPNWEPVTWYPEENSDALTWWGKERVWSPTDSEAYK